MEENGFCKYELEDMQAIWNKKDHDLDEMNLLMLLENANNNIIRIRKWLKEKVEETKQDTYENEQMEKYWQGRRHGYMDVLELLGEI